MRVTGRVLTLACMVVIAACGEQGAQDGSAEDAQQVTAASGANFDNLRGRASLGDDHPGEAIYQAHCAQCHSTPVPRAPDKSFLEMLPGDMILAALNDGVMKAMGAALSEEQRGQVAEFLGGSIEPSSVYPPRICTQARPFDYDDPPFAAGWGIDRVNTRFIPDEVAKLTAADLPKLELQWVFAYPGANRARSQPSFAGGAVHVGSADGTVYALDAETGCMRWSYRASAEVRTGITVTTWTAGSKPEHRILGYFADIIARVYAVDLVTGELVWMTKVDDHPAATTTAQPVLYDGRIYQGVSSLEEAAAADPNYECCNFRGSVVALDADTGAIEWKRYTIDETPQRRVQRENGTWSYGPSGAPVWNSPTIDPKRGRLYVATGGNYSSPAGPTSDAIIALRADSGAVEWVRQVFENDAWNVACFDFIEDQLNCPEEDGPDVDFGSPPMLISGADGDILVAGQKSGDVWGVDPDNGSLRWQRKLGRGGNQGGINFGLAVIGDRVFVPVADYDDNILPPEDARPGIHAVNAFTGEVIWSRPADNVCDERGEHCDPGISQSITAISGAVLSGHLDGRLRAYAAADGRVIWEFDAWRDFATLSGEPARGGSFSGAGGPMVVNGRLYANSGYGIYFHMPGNVLLVFGLPDRS